MDCFVFFTKGRPPKRYMAKNTTHACEQFYAEHPDFHLSELLSIKVANPGRKKTHWLEFNKPHKRTGVN